MTQQQAGFSSTQRYLLCATAFLSLTAIAVSADFAPFGLGIQGMSGMEQDMCLWWKQNHVALSVGTLAAQMSTNVTTVVLEYPHGVCGNVLAKVLPGYPPSEYVLWIQALTSEGAGLTAAAHCFTYMLNFAAQGLMDGLVCALPASASVFSVPAANLVSLDDITVFSAVVSNDTQATAASTLIEYCCSR